MPLPRSLTVMDMNAGRPARILPEIHRRPIHSIVVNSGSPFVTHAAEAYDLVLTAAASDGINMWDLRTERYVSVQASV